MKSNLLRSLAVMAALTASGHAVTINWGSEAFSSLVDSNGNVLGSSFHFELGAFAPPPTNPSWVPAAGNMAEWSDNWRVFDTAAYDSANGVFTSSGRMTDEGFSVDFPNPTFNFQGLSAYLWIHNDNPMTVFGGGEWLLARDENWTFPTTPLDPALQPGCCDNELPLQWSVTDLGSTDMPLYGYQNGSNPSQGGVRGPGDYTYVGDFTLQTETLLPEPSSSVLVLGLAVLALLDRRRAWRC